MRALIVKISFFLIVGGIVAVSAFYFPMGANKVVGTAYVAWAASLDLENSVDGITPVKVSHFSASKSSVGVGKPVWFAIPSIGVNTNVEHLGLTTAGAVAVPAGAHDVSWFDQGARPGQLGSAVISGHYGRWKNGTDSVFNLLPQIKPGDVIYVKDDQGITRSFTVKALKVYGKDETVPEIFSKTDNAYLNIITCHGEYLPSQQTYSQRLVVFAQLNT